jgi:predicted RNA binding protein YcfA (HicA-like mRNA interferase family)
MSRLPALKSSDVIKAIQKAGFIEQRQRGSHKIFKKGALRITVPVHSRDLKRGTLYSIIEQSGLTVDEFMELLK